MHMKNKRHRNNQRLNHRHKFLSLHKVVLKLCANLQISNASHIKIIDLATWALFDFTFDTPKELIF